MIRILVLEDNPKVIEVIMSGVRELEQDLGKIKAVVVSKGEEAEDLADSNKIGKFDVILLDCISADGKTFHQAVLGKADSQKIIAISNTVVYNKMAEEEGVLRTVQKNYYDLIGFKNNLKKEIKIMLNF